MTTPEKKSLAAKLLQEMIFLLTFCAITAMFILLLMEIRPIGHRLDFVEIGLSGNIFHSIAKFAWEKAFPEEEGSAKEAFRALLRSCLSLLTLYAFRYFKNDSPFIDTEGPWESIALMIFCIVVGSFVVNRLLPRKC